MVKKKKCIYFNLEQKRWERVKKIYKVHNIFSFSFVFDFYFIKENI